MHWATATTSLSGVAINLLTHVVLALRRFQQTSAPISAFVR